MAELDTQPQVPPHVLAHAKLVTHVFVSGYLGDIYGHPLFMKKILKALEYEPYITPVRWFNRCNMF